jgi:hypothetical protein
MIGSTGCSARFPHESSRHYQRVTIMIYFADATQGVGILLDGQVDIL